MISGLIHICQGRDHFFFLIRRLMSVTCFRFNCGRVVVSVRSSRLSLRTDKGKLGMCFGRSQPSL